VRRIGGCRHEYRSPYQPDRLLWRQHRLGVVQHCQVRAATAFQIKAQVTDRSRACDGLERPTLCRGLWNRPGRLDKCAMNEAMVLGSSGFRYNCRRGDLAQERNHEGCSISHTHRDRLCPDHWRCKRSTGPRPARGAGCGGSVATKSARLSSQVRTRAGRLALSRWALVSPRSMRGFPRRGLGLVLRSRSLWLVASARATLVLNLNY
jgi:hypothetical protein